jgi:hypothetical protein
VFTAASLASRCYLRRKELTSAFEVLGFQCRVCIAQDFRRRVIRVQGLGVIVYGFWI